MRWSEIRSRVENEFAEDIKKRVSIHFTRHHDRSRSGRAWITIDGKEIANCCDWSAYYPNPDHKPSYKDDLTKYGEFTARDFKDACWALLHQGVEVCAASPNPIFQALAVLHRKFGKRRLLMLVDKTSDTHPLVRYLAELRLSSEKSVP